MQEVTNTLVKLNFPSQGQHGQTLEMVRCTQMTSCSNETVTSENPRISEIFFLYINFHAHKCRVLSLAYNT